MFHSYKYRHFPQKSCLFVLLLFLCFFLQIIYILLCMQNCTKQSIPVRFIRGIPGDRRFHGDKKRFKLYTYDGLYKVNTHFCLDTSLSYTNKFGILIMYLPHNFDHDTIVLSTKLSKLVTQQPSIIFFHIARERCQVNIIFISCFRQTAISLMKVNLVLLFTSFG